MSSRRTEARPGLDPISGTRKLGVMALDLTRARRLALASITAASIRSR
jgi:hypothetical protein